MPSFLKRGAAAHNALKKENVKAETRDKNRVMRFWLPDEATTEITFLDGGLSEDGLLDIVMYYEHQIYMNESWQNWFVCTSEQEPCPVCEGGDNPALVGVMTVIDHKEYEDRKGKTHVNERRLFVAKRHTIKQLQVLATKRKGLNGCRFDVTRTGENSAAVGSVFDFTEKVTAAALKKSYKENAQPYDYEKVIPYLDAKKLRQLGFGSMPVGADDDGALDDDDDDDIPF